MNWDRKEINAIVEALADLNPELHWPVEGSAKPPWISFELGQDHSISVTVPDFDESGVTYQVDYFWPESVGIPFALSRTAALFLWDEDLIEYLRAAVARGIIELHPDTIAAHVAHNEKLFKKESADG